jgi:hypothetical protein
MSGWIKLHRDIAGHWIWKSERRLKWWIDLLLTVNHEPSKVLIKGQLIECGRGQSVMSLESWAQRWGVTKKAVRDFFLLLEKDQMLYTENLQVTTRITICKYEDYQGEVNGQIKKSKRTGNAEETDSAPKQEGLRRSKEFYESEKAKTEDKNYHQFADYLLGKNPLQRPLGKILKMEDQVDAARFNELLRLATENGTSIIDKVNNLENADKKYKSFNLTLTNWLKNKYTK